MEQLTKFFEAIKTDPWAKELLAKSKPDSEDEIIVIYANLAKAMGYALSEKDFREGIKIIIEKQKANTIKAEESVRVLAMDDLANVAGGKQHDGCMDTYKDKENCWYEDGCDIAFYGYPDYICKRNWDDE